MKTLLLAVAAALPLAAQQTPIPPVRLIAAPMAKSPAAFGGITQATELPGGRLLINDPVQRRLVLLDSSLATSTNIMDTTSGGQNSYPRIAGLLPYLGDSALFVDPIDFSMLVVGPNGKIARVAAVPQPRAAAFLIGGVGAPGFDAKHRLVYTERPLPARPAPGDKMFVPKFPDSAFVVAADLTTRTIDTLGTFKVAVPKMSVTQDNGRITMMSEINPLQMSDDWAVTSDGSIAVVHAQDMHIDWINADGTRASTRKLPFEWRRLTDDEKTAVIDSTKAALDRARAKSQAGGRGVAGGGPVVFMRAGVDGGRGAGGGGDAPTPMSLSMPNPTIVPASELPDYRPPFSPGGVRADLDDNLWIRTSQIRANASVPGTIYDIVNRKGDLVDRVEVPPGRTIIAFGKGGVVYMVASDDHAAWIERTHR